MIERGTLGSGELVGGGVGSGGSFPKLGDDVDAGPLGGVLAGRAVSGGPDRGDERTTVAPSSSTYGAVAPSSGFSEAPGDVCGSSSTSANGAASISSDFGLDAGTDGRTDGGRTDGGRIDGGGGAIFPEGGGGTMRPDGGGVSIRPEGGGTSFAIGGIDEVRAIGADPISELLGGLGMLGALGRGPSVVRFFSSGNNPSKPPAGFSLFGDDAMSIDDSSAPGPGAKRSRNDNSVSSMCTRQWTTGGSFETA